MVKNIGGIAFILLGSSIAWFVLAGSISRRTDDSTVKLDPEMASIWGTTQVQEQPVASYQDGFPVTVLNAESSRVNAKLALDYRQKGLLWYGVYVVDFDGAYTFKNTGAVVRIQVEFSVEAGDLRWPIHSHQRPPCAVPSG